MKLKRKINFDICTFCNHACNFCSNPDKRTKKAKTSYTDFVAAMNNVLQYVETNELGLSAKGEVLLNHDLELIIKHCKNIYNIPYVYISSNGALMDKNRATSIIEAGLDSIKFSINAVDSMNYKKVHNRDDFDKVIKNFSTLLELKKEKYPHLKLLISSVITPYNAQNPQEIFNELFGENAKFIDKILPYECRIPQKEYTNPIWGGGMR
ncbi:radical SAM protein [Helicobacter equorum]|uniref:radical SAM protein n=1 Tax=Helicobacter equorum TaxID=361872 RepID=UPI001FD2F527|nr:radical SAM protein [Helicobacter equorum]